MTYFTKKSLTFALFLLMQLSSFSTIAKAEVAIIVHPSNNTIIDAKDVLKLYLGKTKSFPSGKSASLFVNGDNITDEFNKKVLNKSSSQFKAYWSKLAFSGKGTPPEQLLNDEEVKKIVSSDETAIGYIDASKVDNSVKVLFSL